MTVVTHRPQPVHPTLIRSKKIHKAGFAGRLRRINDAMGRYVAHETVKRLLVARVKHPLRVIVLGLTFKEDIPDLRNTRVVDIINELRSFGTMVQVHDPMADAELAKQAYNLLLIRADALEPADAVVLAVAHKRFLEAGWQWIRSCLKGGRGLVMDVKSCLDPGFRINVATGSMVGWSGAWFGRSARPFRADGRGWRRASRLPRVGATAFSLMESWPVGVRTR